MVKLQNPNLPMLESVLVGSARDASVKPTAVYVVEKGKPLVSPAQKLIGAADQYREATEAEMPLPTGISALTIGRDAKGRSK